MIIGLDASRAARARRTGTETYALELIKALAPLTGPGLRLRLYTPPPPQHGDWPDSPQVETRISATRLRPSSSAMESRRVPIRSM